MENRKGVLLVLSGPTCAGKDEVMRSLLERNKNTQRLVTTNTRKMRLDEKEGVDYYFISKSEFEELISKGAFYEWVEYRGGYRGGQVKHVKKALKSGKDVIWRIEVRGVKNIRDKVKKMLPNSVFVMLVSPIKILKMRSIRRSTESKKWMKWSMDMAKWELDQKEDFDYIVVNEEDKLNLAVEEVEKIIESTRKKLKKSKKK